MYTSQQRVSDNHGITALIDWLLTPLFYWSLQSSWLSTVDSLSDEKTSPAKASLSQLVAGLARLCENEDFTSDGGCGTLSHVSSAVSLGAVSEIAEII